MAIEVQPEELEIGRATEEEDAGPKSVCCGAFVEDEEDEDFGCVVGPVLLSVLIVVCGTASTITSKLQYEVRSQQAVERCPKYDDDARDDDHALARTTRDCLFTKPWFQTLVMKMAMSTCLVLALLARKCRRKAPRVPELERSLLGPDREVKPKRRGPDRGAILFCALPALTDLLQTVLAQAGLLWVSSSTYQMTRGSVVVFTCGLSVRYMGKVMTPVHWASVTIVCVAVVLVGVAGLFGGDSGGGGAQAGEYLLGLGLIVFGQVVGAVQFVLEEYLMDERGLTPTMLVGWEGLWGVVYFCALAPALTLTPSVDDDGELASASAIWHENFIETWQEMTNSGPIIILTVTSMVALLLYNLVGNMVTKQLSAIMRAILESCRTLGVWATSIVLYYGFDDSDAGEAWTAWSYLELCGFVLLVYGTVAYKEIVPIPFVSKPAAASP